MNIRSDIPEIFVLRERVENRLGSPLVTHSDFLKLVEMIEIEQRQHISESTLERLWGYSTRGYATVSLRTLNLLATYSTGLNWRDFCNMLSSETSIESGYFSIESILTSELSIGDRVSFGWRPNRECTARYMGDNRFVAEECINSKIQPGDTFICPQFTMGKNLIMTDFRQISINNTTPKTYVVGTNNGLTALKVYSPDK